VITPPAGAVPRAEPGIRSVLPGADPIFVSVSPRLLGVSLPKS
jgi:hypothetical protein